MDRQSKSTIYTNNNHEANVPTPMPSCQQNITPKLSNSISSPVIGNSIPMTIIQQTGILLLILKLKCCCH